ncbi:hypothetical protein QMO56_19340 [Roseomonas sp. E05]|uniref:hypothetical protein n=1 Tax=Roseomonas sp. E05 TaxID=3046310 RepID=UPI0024B91E04|nr:hypothetical protein [Roseomonas sp. E05]MDJ0390271.1 hypothetical protein [Roseomonas sp. E05]
MSIPMRAVFEQLGFEEDWSAITDEAPAYQYDFGNLRLKAVQVTNRHFMPVFLLSGVHRDARSLRTVRFETPLEVASLEQGVALLAHAVGHSSQLTEPAPWLEQGRSWQHHLPWERDRRAYEARPHCAVERDWFRMPAQQLRPLAETATDENVATFTFNGRTLIIDAAGTCLPMPAQGTAWPESYRVRLLELSALPKRLIRPVIRVGVWEGRLTINRLSLRILQTEPETP